MPCPFRKRGGEILDLEFAAFLKDQAREAVAGMQKEAGTNFEVLIEAGNIPETVRRVARTKARTLF